MAEWICINDRLPDEDGHVWAFGYFGGVYLAWYSTREGAFSTQSLGEPSDIITHWLPAWVPEQPPADKVDEVALPLMKKKMKKKGPGIWREE